MKDEITILEGQISKFENIDELNNPNLSANQQKAIYFLTQIKEFYDLSIDHKIDTDIHIGNFRLSNGSDNVVLTDFRESIEKNDLMCNKRTELRDLKKTKNLGNLFSENCIDAFFQDTLDKLNQEDEMYFSEDDFSDNEGFLGAGLGLPAFLKQ